MNNLYTTFLANQYIPGQPLVNYDSSRKQLVHVYQNVSLETNNFQKEVSSYLNRKESYSGNVVVINKIKDQHITYNSGLPAMQISVVTDYVPWRLHLATNNLTLQQVLFIMDGACKGFRQLLHRVRYPFLVKNFMIGVDGQAKVKIWWNQHFYHNKFGFEMKTNTKLQDMVKSLVEVLIQKMQNKQDWASLQKIIFDKEITFLKLEERVKQASKNLNFKEIGLDLISSSKDHLVVLQQLRKMESSRISNPIEETLRLSFGSVSSRKGYLSTERMILSPQKQQKLEFNQKVVTRRIYRDGTSPSMNEKLKVIKGDIQNLRSVANKDLRLSTAGSKLRSSKSVQAIVSVRKGLTGDTRIPEIKKIIKESEIVGSNQDLMLSRFVQPHANPQNIQSCLSIQGQNDKLYLSRLKKMIGQQKQINSTSRSINESRFEQFMSSSNIRQGKFGQSDKKIPYVNSFHEL